MAPSQHSHHHQQQPKSEGVLGRLWNSFWSPPSSKCPKCGSAMVEYYDPFFFSPGRTLKGKRRLKCLACRFIWRPQRHSRSLLDIFLPRA